MTSAFAGSITINRDSTWDEDAEAKATTFTIYKIFEATIGTSASVTAATGASTGGNAAYYIAGTDANATAKKTALASLFSFTEAADGNFYATKTYTGSDADFFAALKTAVTASGSGFTAESPVTSSDSPVVLNPTEGVGYYLILASNGKDIVVQTLDDVVINEKNDYPTIDKKQKQEDDPDYHEAVEPAELGSYIDYQITVHVPQDATKAIKVFDTMSTGLAWDTNYGTNGLTVTPATATYTALTDSDTEYDGNATWQIVFADSVVQSLRGQDIVITYRAQVTADALTVDTRKNEAKLSYDEGNYVLKDEVDFTTYFAGIYKVDPDDSTADMSGVKFALKDKNGDPVNVTWDSTNGYYVVDAASSSNEVVTRDDGSNYTIKIRGLDSEMGTYTLTETETKNGYNLLATPANLTLIEDKGTAFEQKAANTYDEVENRKGTTLPSTGGIGTTLFYIGGGILVLLAVVMLVTKKRMKAED